MRDLWPAGELRLFVLFVRQKVNVEVSKCSSLFYVLVINTVKMCIGCQNAHVPLQRWSKSLALVETSATRLQQWEQEGRAGFNLRLPPPIHMRGQFVSSN